MVFNDPGIISLYSYYYFFVSLSFFFGRQLLKCTRLLVKKDFCSGQFVVFNYRFFLFTPCHPSLFNFISLLILIPPRFCAIWLNLSYLSFFLVTGGLLKLPNSLACYYLSLCQLWGLIIYYFIFHKFWFLRAWWFGVKKTEFSIVLVILWILVATLFLYS